MRNTFQLLLLWSGLSIFSLTAHTAEVELNLIGDVVNNVQGGIETGTAALANIDLTYAANLSEFGLSEHADVFVYFLGNAGDDPTEWIGDAQVTSNIEAPDRFKLYEMWYRHYVTDEIAVLFGLHDYNSSFATLDSSGLFINSSFGIGAEIAQVGPSIFPTTAIGLVLNANWTSQYLYLGLYDGVPGDPDNDRGTRIKFDSKEGLFTALEWGAQGTEDQPWKWGIGFWHHSAEVANPINEQTEDNNHGVYLLGERPFAENWSTFLQLGIADPERNIIGSYIGGGITRSELFTGDDMLGLAIASARTSDDFDDANPTASKHETALELTYLYPLNEHFSIQPNLQYVIHPGFDPAIDDAMVITLRVEMGLSF